eukprot:6293341-Prymnesium_polylepis.1
MCPSAMLARARAHPGDPSRPDPHLGTAASRARSYGGRARRSSSLTSSRPSTTRASPCKSGSTLACAPTPRQAKPSRRSPARGCGPPPRSLPAPT